MATGDKDEPPTRGHDATPARVERRAGPRPQRVLVVDDYPDLLELWDCWLTFWGFTVLQAKNGLEAVCAATAHPPHLILMDICMPVMDGWRAMELLKASPRTAHVPIVALTALGFCGDGVARAEAAGCGDFLCKPCEPYDLLLSIRKVLGQSTPGSGRPLLPRATPEPA